jgi:hypothetical protein
MAGKDAKFAYAHGTDKTALVDKKTKRYPHEELKTGYSRRALYGKKKKKLNNSKRRISISI